MVEKLSNHVEEQPKRRLFIASKSKIKADAVRAALGDVEVIAVDSESRISEQPIGYAETLRGARNRITTGRENGATGEGAAIENGVIRGEELLQIGMTECIVSNDRKSTIIPEGWYDLALVLITDEDGYEALATTQAIEVPKRFIEQALAVPERDKTWAKFMLEELDPEGKIINHQDPHAYLTGVSRVELMKEAIRRADTTLSEIRQHS